MKRKKKFIFLPVVMAAILMLGACNKSSSNNTPADDNTQQNDDNNQQQGGGDNNNPVTTFTVSFGANGGSGEMADVTGISGEYTLPDCSFTAPEGKHFAGWKVGGEGDLLAAGAKINVTANVQLVAQWETTTYVVSFGANGGTGEMANVAGVVGSYTLPENAFTPPVGKVFAGWKVNGEGNLLQPGASITVSANVQLVAQYETAQYTVQFKVDGENYGEAQTVAHGGKVEKPADPTKAAGGDVYKYRFAGWDKDLDAEITANTVINAKFEAYAAEMVVDDFESYTSGEAVVDAGWTAIGWTNDNGGGWTDQTAAAVSLGVRSVEGNKSLRFSAWQNNMTYKIRKDFEANAFAKEANALQFRLAVPRGMSVNILFTANADVIDSETKQVKNMDVEFQYKFTSETSEFVQYTIPLNDMNWKAWGGEGKTIKLLANAIGLHEDDILKTAKRIEFSLKGDDGGTGASYLAYLDSLKAVTLDEPANTQVETMGQYTTYTGTTAHGNVVKIQLGANGAATATIVDMETPMVIPGTVAVNNKEVTFTSTTEGQLTYKTRLVDGGRVLEYVSATGALAAEVANMDCNAVQVVDNFESYANSGQAYCQKYTDKDARSGARGAFYQEYYAGSGSSPWGGSGWTLMGGNGDQLELNRNDAAAHSGNNFVSLKHSKSVAMRYMQWGLFDGSSEKRSFHGSTFSFWAKTEGLVKQIKVYAYSAFAPTHAKMNENVKILTINNTAEIGEWTHYELELNPKLAYYGFMIDMEKNTALSSNQSYLYIDDVEVYTANPYATYVAPVLLKTGSSYMGKVGGLVNVTLEIKSGTEVSLKAAGLGLEENGTYEIEDDELTMSVGGATYKATISNELDKFTFVSVSGSGQAASALNNLSFDIVRGLSVENAESYTETGRTIKTGDTDETKNSGSSGAYYIDLYKGGSNSGSTVGGTGWTLTGSGAGAALNKTDAVEGSQSLKLLNSQWGNMRYIQWDLYKGTAQAMNGMSGLSIYLKNFSDAKNQKVKIMAYFVQQVDNAHQGAAYRTEREVTLTAGQGWTKYTVALDATKTYYGFALLTTAVSGTDCYVGVDNVEFYSIDKDPALNFYGKENVVLNGTSNSGAASFKFGTGGKIYLSCPNEAFVDEEGAYTMEVGPSGQVITMNFDGNTITGIYSVSALGEVTITITGSTGGLATFVDVDTVFSNQ